MPLLSGVQAAALLGVTPAALRKEVMRSPQLRACRTMLDLRTPVYDRRKLLAWQRSRPRYKDG